MVNSAEFWKETNGKKNNSCIAGHARLPTSGTVDTAHCHPFIVDHIVGMHNGTITKIDGRKVNDDDSDSELLFELIAKRGIEAINQVEGAYALCYVNTNNKTLNFIRNDKRPLYFAQYKDAPNTLYWASEHGMLTYVLGREVGEIKYFRIPPGVLHSFNLYFEGEVVPISTKQVVKKTSVPDTGTGKSSILTLDPRCPNSSPTSRSQTDYGHSRYQTLGRFTLSHDELIEVLNNGCDSCRHSATIDDWRGGKLTFFTSTDFMCRECIDTNETARAYVIAHGVTPPQRSN